MSIRMIMEDTLDKWLVSDSGISSAAVRVRMAMRDMKPRTIKDVIAVSGVKPCSVWRAVEELISAEWVTDLRPRDRKPRLIGAIFPPEVEVPMCKEVRHAYSGARFAGEWIMRAKLDLLAGSRRYIDDHRPQLLRRLETGYRLEFDRDYIDDKVIFEYQGSGHHPPVGQPDKEAQYQDQVIKDAQKLLFAKRMGMEVVEVTAVELTGDHMIRFISGRLPLTAYAYMPGSPLVQLLQGTSNSYAAAVLGPARQSGR